MYKKLLFFLLLIACISCNNSEEGDSAVTWIGGEIVNPKSEFVILYKDSKVLDTVKLDSNNYFLYRSEELCPGLYAFRHNEYQLFYVEPGDSIMLRVNTIEFDESLSFSGRGGERNNLLMEYFLLNDLEHSLMPSYYGLTPQDFEQKLDSFRKIKTTAYKDFTEKNSPTAEFRKIAFANIDYDHYLKKELYIFANSQRIDINNFEKFPSEFFAYRKKVNYGDSTMRSYFPYYRFLNKYFDNLSYGKYKNTIPNRRYLTNHYLNKIKIIDSLVTDDSLKNNLLRTNVGRYLINGNDLENSKPLVDLFLQLNTNEAHKIEISSLSKACEQIQPGKELPNVLLLNAENTAKDIHSLIKRPTVLYFWSFASVKHYRTIHAKAAELASKYPEYDFIGINTDTHFKKWRNVVELSKFNKQNEYQFDNIEIAERKLVINSMNKAMILDKNAIILKNNSSLFSRNIETELLSFLNK